MAGQGFGTRAAAENYLAQPAERLVLEGYRGWTWAVALGTRSPWDNACAIYRGDLGARADGALEALDGFASTLGLCVACPLRMQCAGAASVCRDEALVLALIAAVQHADDAALEVALGALSPAHLADRLALAAGIYGLLMRSLARVLCPVPAGVVQAIAQRASAATPASRTLH